jgi:CheY-like chemotaxis protein
VSGIELYKHIQKMAQSLARKVFFITGDVMGVDTKDFLTRTKALYLAKPFDNEELKKNTKRLLAQVV